MTIPSLINKTNEQETVSALKKTYSSLSQAYQKIFAENGEITPAVLGTTSPQTTKTLGDMFVKEMNVQKVCGQEAGGDCFSTQNGGMYKDIVGNDWDIRNNANSYKLVLSDGTSVGINAYKNYYDYGDSEALKYVLGGIVVDVNGDKDPNAKGKDVFKFHITKYGIIPSGTQGDTDNPPENCRTHGLACAAWVITKGNMDYLKKDVSWR